MTRKEFEKLVQQGIDAVEKRFLDKMDNVVIVVDDFPTNDQLDEADSDDKHLLLGLYEGIPQTERWHYGQVLPDKITIFQKNIERIAKDDNDIKKIVRDTVWHEIAHHFGMDEERVRRAEEKLDKKKSKN